MCRIVARVANIDNTGILGDFLWMKVRKCHHHLCEATSNQLLIPPPNVAVENHHDHCDTTNPEPIRGGGSLILRISGDLDWRILPSEIHPIFSASMAYAISIHTGDLHSRPANYRNKRSEPRQARDSPKTVPIE